MTVRMLSLWSSRPVAKINVTLVQLFFLIPFRFQYNGLLLRKDIGNLSFTHTNMAFTQAELLAIACRYVKLIKVLLADPAKVVL